VHLGRSITNPDELVAIKLYKEEVGASEHAMEMVK